MNLFDFITQDELDDLPEDHLLAFSKFVQIAQRRLSEYTSPRLNTDDESEWHDAWDARHCFVNIAIAAARRLSVPMFAELEVPMIGQFDDKHYRQFMADLDLRPKPGHRSSRARNDGEGWASVADAEASHTGANAIAPDTHPNTIGATNAGIDAAVISAPCPGSTTSNIGVDAPGVIGSRIVTHTDVDTSCVPGRSCGTYAGIDATGISRTCISAYANVDPAGISRAGVSANANIDTARVVLSAAADTNGNSTTGGRNGNSTTGGRRARLTRNAGLTWNTGLIRIGTTGSSGPCLAGRLTAAVQYKL